MPLSDKSRRRDADPAPAGEVFDGKTRWWLLKEPHQQVCTLVRRIRSEQAWRYQKFGEWARMYGGDVSPIMAGSPRLESIQAGRAKRLTLNVVRSCIDTAAARVSKNKPKPLFLTSDGDYDLRLKAENLTKVIEGVFSEIDVYRKGQLAFRDCEVFGTGALKFYLEDGRVKAERTQIDELTVDDLEGIYGEPRQIHQTRIADRETMCALFPKHAARIKSAAQASLRGSTLKSPNLVEVIESWHLPSTEGSNDGWHTICLESVTLLRETYKKQRFPFVFIRWSDSLAGFYGTGLADELSGIQAEITKIILRIQQSMHLMSVPRIGIPRGAKVSKGDLNNRIGQQIEFDGQPPVPLTWPAASPEVYQHLERLIAKAYEITGVSMSSASSQKPAGIDSAVGIREVADIESTRFVLQGQMYEKMYMDAARIVIDLMRDLETTATIKARYGKFIKQIKWSEVNLEDDQFEMDIFPVSFLPTSPAGRLQYVSEMQQMGMINREDAMDMFDFPDLEKYISLQTSARRNAQFFVDKMLQTGEYTPPEPQMNLKAAMDVAQAAYLDAQTKGVDEERLELLRTWMDDVVDLQKPPPGPEVPPGAPPMDAPPMPPAPIPEPPAPEMPPAPPGVTIQ